MLRFVALRCTVPSVKRALPEILTPLVGFLVISLVVLWVAGQANVDLLSHSPYDSYTLQALAWRDGNIPLSQNYPWLELAIFDGEYYVSFPPLPAVPMWILTFPFGEETPNAVMGLVYFFGGLAALYVLLRRYMPADQATVWLVFVALGGTLLSLAVAGETASGGVWFQAQLLGFFLTSLAFLLVDGKRKVGWGIGLACIALAVGCRPFNALYVPVLLWMLLGHLGYRKKAVLPYLVAPAVIGAVFAIYNAFRFGSPLEFGHRYLPELKQAGEGMFVPSRIPNHFENVMQAPSIEGGKLTVPPAGGFAVYLTNPMLVVGLGAIIARGVRRKIDITDALLFVTILIHGALLLSHRTNGGWQYGTRYLTDLVPALVFVVARGGTRIRLGAAMLMGVLIAFNVYALLTFHAL